VKGTQGSVTDAVVVADVDAGGFAGMGAAAVVDAEVSPALGAVTGVDAGVVAAVDIAAVEVVVWAELVEPQPLSTQNKKTNAAWLGTVNALTWIVMAAFSYRGMIHAERKRLSIAMHPDVRRVYPRTRGTKS
jgi:DNA-binding LytR/AlgR family response regulator